MSKMTLLSMSKVYEREDFYRPFVDSYKYIDCSDIKGTNCYVDETAINSIRERLKDVDASGIHYIDSGNYHYLSYMFLEKIQEDFELVLIDKHPDCKRPMFDSLISCGSWILEALYQLPNLKRVYMIGVDVDLVYELDDLGSLRDRALVVRSKHKLQESKLPIYISVDKDVLSEEVVNVNWDQGNMMMDELEMWIEELSSSRRIIGVDICGEPDRNESDSAYASSSRVNGYLLECFNNIN